MTERRGSPFCHIVIPAPDLELAKVFYERVFGWRVQANVPGRNYWFFESGNVGGAFNDRKTPAPGSTVLVLRVADIDEAVAAIRENGGAVTQEPGAIGEADSGRDAYFLDPNGNEMGIYCDS
jgi:predicted enzyme related to lactoylglutathione lyase